MLGLLCTRATHKLMVKLTSDVNVRLKKPESGDPKNDVTHIDVTCYIFCYLNEWRHNLEVIFTILFNIYEYALSWCLITWLDWPRQFVRNSFYSFLYNIRRSFFVNLFRIKLMHLTSKLAKKLKSLQRSRTKN